MLANKQPNILIVDDEPQVRSWMQAILSSQNYPVWTAENGKDAIKIAADPDSEIDILITDIIMPQMNGKDLANRIAAIRPFIKVLFISAYTAEILAPNNLCPEGADLIKKPFTRETLLDRISRVWASSPKWKELVSGG
jgi:two-component system cell cycle sensor histidine kinase/response regulator CckA